MMDEEMMFPETVAAVAACVAAQPGLPRQAPGSYKAAVIAYQNELLPKLLGGAWTMSKSSSKSSIHRLPGMISYSDVLFDHHEIFRIHPGRGPLTWHETVILGQPYNAITNEGVITDWARDEAAPLNKLRVVVWVRPDLSAWYPGSTQLVLASRRLSGLDPSAYGFRLIGEQSVT